MNTTTSICSDCGKTLASNAPQGLCPECLLKAGLGSGVDIGSATQTVGGHTPFVAPPPEELAKLFPHLEILGFVGQGGMGAVYKVRQKELDRVAALKILPPGIGTDPAFAERFTREARALARLNHPGVVTLYEFGRADGLYFFLMEFVDGVNLSQLLERGRVSPREALAIVPQICDALQYAHDQGIVHRDVKPENILLDRRGRVKVADFGLAKLIAAGTEPAARERTDETSATLTEAGKIMGTPHYMAPEQVEHPDEVDHRADIYGLGVVFYQILTGELPGKRIEPPSRKVEIDVRLDEIVLRALEKEPGRRYQQASQVKTDVETIAGSVAAGPAGANAAAGKNPSPMPVLRWRDRWLWEFNAIRLSFFPLALLMFVGIPFLVYHWNARVAAYFSPLVGGAVGLTGAYLWVGYRIGQMIAALPRSEAEVAQGWIAWEKGMWPFNRSQGLAVLHPDRLELIPAWHGVTITIPLADIISVREMRWMYVPLFWKRGFVLQLANGERVGVAIPEPFARRWRTRLSHGALPELPAELDERPGGIEWTGVVAVWAVLFSILAAATVVAWFASDRSFSLPACLSAVFALSSVVICFGVLAMSFLTKSYHRRGPRAC